MKKASMRMLVLLAFLVYVAVPAFAQTGFDTADGSPPDDEPTDVPIDGGTLFLIIAGVALALYRLYKVSTQFKTKLAVAK